MDLDDCHRHSFGYAGSAASVGMTALKAGVALSSVRRPLEGTVVCSECVGAEGDEALVGLLDNNDDRLKRLAAKDVIDFIIRHKENEDLDKRLKEVEKRLAEK